MADDLPVMFATNRTILKEKPAKFGNRFNEAGASCYRVGTATVRKKDSSADLEKDGVYQVDTSTIELAPDQTELSDDGGRTAAQDMFDDLRKKMLKDPRDVLIYLHGFANSMESALDRAGELKDKYRVHGKRPHVFAFGWPSDGKTQPSTKYHDDRVDALFSGIAMARALLRLIDFLRDLKELDERCGCGIHLVAHSMGNYALRCALQHLETELGVRRLPRLFNHVFLMAADVDEDAFEHDTKLGRLPETAEAIHVYHTPGDWALVISDWTKGNPDRLGQDGPRTMDGLSDKIEAIDCRAVDYTGLAHGWHQFYRLRREVIRDVCLVLNGVPASQIPGRQPGDGPRRWRLIA